MASYITAAQAKARATGATSPTISLASLTLVITREADNQKTSYTQIVYPSQYDAVENTRSDIEGLGYDLSYNQYDAGGSLLGDETYVGPPDAAYRKYTIDWSNPT